MICIPYVNVSSSVLHESFVMAARLFESVSVSVCVVRQSVMHLSIGFFFYDCRWRTCARSLARCDWRPSPVITTECCRQRCMSLQTFRINRLCQSPAFWLFDCLACELRNYWPTRLHSRSYAVATLIKQTTDTTCAQKEPQVAGLIEVYNGKLTKKGRSKRKYTSLTRPIGIQRRVQEFEKVSAPILSLPSLTLPSPLAPPNSTPLLEH